MKSLIKILAFGLFLALIFAPVVASAIPDESAATRAPVAQPLVREGTLAMKLAEALKLGTPANEAEAEAALVSAGIAPKNGWVGDYPVTPDIVGELQASVSDAAAAGRLTMSQADAAKTYQDVIDGYNLAVSTAPASDVTGEYAPPEYPDTTAVDTYYYDEGPPIVTYYAPPADYAYLYSWVPYPFWGWGYWYPGFFVLADFDVDFGHHGHHHHDGHHDGHYDGHDGHFSNHYRDPHRGDYARIDPAGRANGGILNDRTSRWTNPTVQRSASGILNRAATLGRTSGMVSTSGRSTGTGITSLNRRDVQSGNYSTRDVTGASSHTGRGQQSYRTPSSGTYNRTPSIGSRSSSSFNGPSVSRSFSEPRYRAPSVGRSFSQPSYRAPSASGSFSRPSISTAPSGRSFSAPSGVSRGGGFSGGRGSFSGGGSFGGRGGGSFGGRR